MGAKIQKLNDTLLNAKRIIILLLVSVLVLLPVANFSVPAGNEKYKIDVVVIDAGHGGHDPGTIGYSKTHEKNISLAVAVWMSMPAAKARLSSGMSPIWASRRSSIWL